MSLQCSENMVGFVFAAENGRLTKTETKMS